MNRPVDRTLPNGLRILALDHGVMPMVEARLHLPAPCLTPADLAASMLLATCLSLGHDAGDGVELSATGDVHRVGVTASAALTDLDVLLAALADVVDGTPGDLLPARGQLVAQLRVLGAHPDIATRAALARHLFGDHPVSHPVPGADDVAAITELHRPFDPRGAVLIILAPGDPGRLADAAEKALTGWTGCGTVTLPPLGPIETGRLTALPQPGTSQSRIRLRAPAVPVDDERYPALFVASNVTGGALSSRLARSLREDKGYVYGIMSYFDLRPGRPLLAIEADTAAATTSAALEVLGGELHRLGTTHPPTEAEVHAARTYALGSSATRLASRAAYANALFDLAAKSADPLLLFDFTRRIGATTTEEVVAAAAEYLAPGRFSGVVAADPEALPETLSLVR
ncbi:M16 family metallopeptidase [Herbidospora mongoliensis]|uniref:M16 family metallopeptidase n=1 Tax=Herbidospora mongoliensis TaxID=688067 RepID=UPI00082E9392|nr:insulinase family protein [Herbidospora mongoliensis]